MSLNRIMSKVDLSKNRIFWWTTILLTIFISQRLYQTTTWGAGLSTDSITYIEGARSILTDWNLEGIGTHYPPLYFILIALVGFFTNDTLEALRCLQIFTVAINFVIFSLIVWKGTNKAIFPTIICSVLFVTSQSVLHIHTMAWSEGSFCLFALLGFYFLANYLEYENRQFQSLLFSALFIGLAFLTRYIGITLIITGVITLALYVSGNKRKRISDCFCFCFVSSLPMLAWLIRNWLINQEVTSRPLVVHVISAEKIQVGLQVLLSWLFIPSHVPLVLLVVLLLIAVIYVISLKELNAEHLNRTPEICFIFIFVYITFLLISISLFDAHTPLDARILFPVYLSFILCVGIMNHRVYCAKSIKSASYLIFFMLIVLAYAQAGVQKQYASYVRNHGIGFASKEWAYSDMLQWVKNLPSSTIIYTNGPDAIKIIANRSSTMIPRIISPVDRKKNINIHNEINEMASEISGHKGVIVYFNGITWRWYLPTIKILSQLLPLQFVYKGNDGVAMEINAQFENEQP